MIKKNDLIFSCAFILLLTVIFLYPRSLKRLDVYIQWVNHTQEVITSFTELSNDFKSAEMIPSDMGQRHKDGLLELYRASYESIPHDIGKLKYLVRDNPRQQKRLDTLLILFNHDVKMMLESTVTDSTQAESVTTHFITVLTIQRLIDNGIAAEKDILARQKSELRKTIARSSTLAIVLILIALALIIVITISNIKQVKKRRNVESFLESVLNTSRNAIITYQAIRDGSRIIDFKILFSNDYPAKKIPMVSKQFIGKTLLDIPGFTIDNKTFFKFIRVTETGKKDEFEMSFPMGTMVRWYNVLLSKLNDGLTASFHDITDLKNYQKDLQHKLELLEYKNNELEQFAYVASHDLQEPLRKIRTFSSLINERFNEPSAAFAKVYLSKVIFAADRMSSLIKDLLNLSDLSQQDQYYDKTDLNIILENVLNDLELVIEEKHAVVTSDPLQVIDAIPMQMNQLLFNLINNALKFARKDMVPRIFISSDPVKNDMISKFKLDPRLSYYQLTVRDNGIGFSEEFADKIFVLFQRLHNRQAYSGSGIGLAICKKIVLNHKGEIYAEGGQNEGASFHIILPTTQPRKTPEHVSETRSTSRLNS